MYIYSRIHIYPCQTYPFPANQTQTYTARLHQSSCQYSTMHIYQGQTYPSWTQIYRAQLHQSSFWYSTMHIFPGQMYPPWIKPRPTEPDYTKAVADIAQCTYSQVRHNPVNRTQTYRAWLHQSSFWYSTCTYTQVRCTPHKSNPELQSLTTPKQFPI